MNVNTIKGLKGQGLVFNTIEQAESEGRIVKYLVLNYQTTTLEIGGALDIILRVNKNIDTQNLTIILDNDRATGEQVKDALEIIKLKAPNCNVIIVEVS